MSGTYSPEQRLFQAVILQALIDVAGLAKRVESKLKPELLREIEKMSVNCSERRDQISKMLCLCRLATIENQTVCRAPYREGGGRYRRSADLAIIIITQGCHQ